MISLWTEIARNECKEILRYLWTERSINVRNDNKVEDAISLLLKEFSVATIFYILWYGATRTSDAIAKGHVNQFMAHHYALQVSRNRAGDISSGKTERRNFNRNPYISRSEISYVLFDTILGIGEQGFNERIDRKLLD